MKRIKTALFAVLIHTSLLAQQAGESPCLVGRCPVDNVTSIFSGKFVTSDIDDILGVQDLGRIPLSLGPGQQRTDARLCRLVLLRLSGSRFRTVWQTQPLLAAPVPRAGLGANAWTTADLDSDSRLELLIFNPDSCQVVSFGPDSIRTRSYDLPGSWVTDAVLCDIDADSAVELVTLELSPFDTLCNSRLLRVYEPTDSGLEPVSEYVSGLNWGEDVSITLLGTGRLEDYWTELPVLAGIYTSLRPSIYAVLHQAGPDSFALTFNPFPWQEWFTKKQVLPAGELTLFSVEDTLVAYGYFVPGSRPSGPSKSFAALQDGEWRLLSITHQARHIAGPVCRFTLNGNPGWLELRDNIFHFYPGHIFDWR